MGAAQQWQLILWCPFYPILRLRPCAACVEGWPLWWPKKRVKLQCKYWFRPISNHITCSFDLSPFKMDDKITQSRQISNHTASLPISSTDRRIEAFRVSVKDSGVYGGGQCKGQAPARTDSNLRCSDCPLGYDCDQILRDNAAAASASRRASCSSLNHQPPIIIVEPKNDDSVKCDCRNCQFFSGWCCMPCLLVIFVVILIFWLCWSSYHTEEKSQLPPNVNGTTNSTHSNHSNNTSSSPLPGKPSNGYFLEYIDTNWWFI